MWIDSHAHLGELSEELLGTQLSNAHAKNVCGILNVGTNMSTSQALVAQLSSKRHGINMWGAVGISAPEAHLFQNNSAWLSCLRDLASVSSVIAIGETGIDGHNTHYPPLEQQLHLFRTHLQLANDMQKPVIIHSRGLEKMALAECKAHGISQAIFHCFTGSADNARAIADAGYCISFSGIITFKNNALKSVVQAVPDDALLLETDSPYLSPHPLRGTINEPAHVHLVGERIAELRNISVTECARITSNNFLRVFDIPRNININN